jgi:drug/metabolite transporter (DMT)-like permease
VTTGEAVPLSQARGIRLDSGLLAAVLSSATFATSGPFAKALLAAGWTAGSVVTARVGLAGLILLGPAVYAVRGRPGVLRRSAGLVGGFGLFAVAGCQVAYFNAIQHVPIGVALLLEYLGVVLVVLWVWLRSRQAPTTTTLVGVPLSLLGLVLVLDLRGSVHLDPVGVAWGLAAAVGLAVYFVVSAHGDTGLPPVALASFGMLMGTAVLLLLSWVGVLPTGTSAGPVVLRGAVLPWWLAVAELAVVAAAVAYLLGAIGARRLGSTVASFVGLTEVLFAVLLAWGLLGELPTPTQLGGGALIMAGVVAVRTGELRATRSAAQGGLAHRPAEATHAFEPSPRHTSAVVGEL